MAEYKILKTEGRAKRAEFHTVHGTIQTPVFMNVGTIGAIKGGIDPFCAGVNAISIPPGEYGRKAETQRN